MSLPTTRRTKPEQSATSPSGSAMACASSWSRPIPRDDLSLVARIERLYASARGVFEKPQGPDQQAPIDRRRDGSASGARPRSIARDPGPGAQLRRKPRSVPTPRPGRRAADHVWPRVAVRHSRGSSRARACAACRPEPGRIRFALLAHGTLRSACSGPSEPSNVEGSGAA